MFDGIESRLEIAGWLVAKTAFRIGAGRSTEVVGTDLPVVRDVLGKPYIPGSSLKGILRSRLESFVRAIRDDPKLACDPTDRENWCVKAGDIEDKNKGLARKIEQKQLEAKDRDQQFTLWLVGKTCLVCRTFGSPWLASPLLLRDLPVDESLWFDQFQVRNGVAIDRDTETASEGKLYDYEVIPPGTRFSFRLLVENGEPWQWGMVFLGLKELENGAVAIGGSKSRGLGTMKLEIEKRKLFSLDGGQGDERLDKVLEFLDGKGFRDVSAEEVKGWIEKFKEKLRELAKEVKT
ncbi:MAG TPA: CRISPR-associated RAMP protein Csx7 [Terriglobia bacterium]|nr:CRISPR-associated RAMP protein Csx7 [Terriglobia bacterium]